MRQVRVCVDTTIFAYAPTAAEAIVWARKFLELQPADAPRPDMAEVVAVEPRGNGYDVKFKLSYSWWEPEQCPQCGGTAWAGGTDADPRPWCKQCGAPQPDGE